MAVGRKLVLPKNFNRYDFGALAKKEKHAKVRMRLLGLSHLQDGKTLQAVNELCKVNRSSVREWLDRFSRGGIKALEEQPGRGRKPYFSREKAEELKAAIEALQASRQGGRVLGEDIQRLMEKKFNVKYSLSGIYLVLSDIKMVWISAHSRHPKQSKAVQEHFKKTSLKK